jgi:hypothetical protein
MPLLRPWIAEIDIEPVHLTGRENLLDAVDVEDEQAHVREIFLRDLLRRRVEYILLRLDADEIHIRLAFGELTDEIALARAELHMKRRLPAEHLRPAPLLRLARGRILREYERIKIVDGLIHPGFPS